MKQLVLDAGPLIALFYAKDTYHQECVIGFQQLAQQKTILLIPIPIIFQKLNFWNPEPNNFIK